MGSSDFQQSPLLVLLFISLFNVGKALRSDGGAIEVCSGSTAGRTVEVLLSEKS